MRGEPLLPDSTLGADMTIDRLNTRRGLLQQIDDQLRAGRGAAGLGQLRPHAAAGVRPADLVEGPQGRLRPEARRPAAAATATAGTLFGNSTLIARRLVEAGVRFVNVTWDLFWDRIQIDYDAWDTHTQQLPAS